MKTFEQFKQEILEKARQAEACKEELLQVILDNLKFCWDNKVIDCDNIQFYSKDELNEAGIYINHKESINISKNANFISNDSSKIGYVRSYGNSLINISNLNELTKITPNDNSIIRNCLNCKIYIKKSKFEIIEI